MSGHWEDDIRRAVNEILDLLETLRGFELYDHIDPRPGPPATAAQIDRYEKHLGVALPPSYRCFLEMYDGFRWLAFPGDMLSIADVMPDGAYFDSIKEWKMLSAAAGSGEVLDGIVVANLGQSSNWAYLNPRKPAADDEMTVVFSMIEFEKEFPNIVAFLEDRREQLKLAIETEIEQQQLES